VGRKKDVFNCSDGSNVYPSYLELLLESNPLVRQAVVVGDRRPFLAALVVPDGTKIAAALKCAETVLTKSEIEAAVRVQVEKINAGLEQYEQIRRIAVVDGDFPATVRSVTTLQKIKIDRKAVDELYRKEIDGIYSTVGDGGGSVN